MTDLPYAYETKKLKIPALPGIDRRVKLTPQQRQEIRENVGGMGVVALAREYGVSNRTIQFILRPEDRVRNLALRQARGGSMRYYDREKNNAATREHRQYKKQLFEEGKLE